MQLVILHYHLNRGGVTQVIQNHLRALSQSPPEKLRQVVVLYGGRRTGWPASMATEPFPFRLELIEVPRLEYDASPVAAPHELAAAIRESLEAVGVGSKETILHAHNHALGKNASFPGALTILARSGYRLLLQLHDFAEDFRPAGYRHLAAALCQAEPQSVDSPNWASSLYPQATQVHYAVLNGRDAGILSRAGFSVERTHLLANPAAEFANLPTRGAARPVVAKVLGLSEAQRLSVYPVRGIRRKNVGEFLLLSALDPRQSVYAVTLAPLNPAELASFASWRTLAEQLDLPCRFDTGGEGGLSLGDVLAASDELLTTSVAEGFGMVFLESWLAGRPLRGRNLPEITSDFVDAGLQFRDLYDRLAVPLTIVDEAQARADLTSAYRSVCAAYAQAPVSAAVIERQLNELIVDNTIDFAYLSSRLQQHLIEQVSRTRQTRKIMWQANPQLEESFTADPPAGNSDSLSRDLEDDAIAANAALIRRSYSIESMGSRLRHVYRSILDSPVEETVGAATQSDQIVNQFLDIRRLHPVRLI